MISVVMSAAIYAAAVQAAVNAPRQAYVACLRTASAKAQSAKVPAETVSDFLKSACTAESSSFVSALVAFDTKNGVPRKQANSDAQLQLDDYLLSAADTYKVKVAN